MLTEDYRVRLDAFEGPLDLLLFLIRKNEVDVHDIPIATIAGQYLSYLEGVDRIDIDLAGEFLVTAATLMEIKSRLLAPAEHEGRPPGEHAVAGEDPRAELVRQLLAYKKYRDAAEALEQRAEDWRRRFPAGVAGVDQEKLREALEAHAESTDVEDLDLLDLVDAFRRISETVNFDRLGDHQVVSDDTPLELHAEDIVDHLARGPKGSPGEVPFPSLFAGRTRSDMVGLFLALLHLVARRRVGLRVEADRQISVFLREDEPAPDAASAPME